MFDTVHNLCSTYDTFFCQRRRNTILRVTFEYAFQQSFLADYGMVWIGDEEEGSGDEGEEEHVPAHDTEAIGGTCPTLQGIALLNKPVV